jgi:hypothetical protein
MERRVGSREERSRKKDLELEYLVRGRYHL